eukprot:10708331-Lingulodinium_polyedra.AAC.1
MRGQTPTALSLSRTGTVRTWDGVTLSSEKTHLYSGRTKCWVTTLIRPWTFLPRLPRPSGWEFRARG